MYELMKHISDNIPLYEILKLMHNDPVFNVEDFEMLRSQVDSYSGSLELMKTIKFLEMIGKLPAHPTLSPYVDELLPAAMRLYWEDRYTGDDAMFETFVNGRLKEFYADVISNDPALLRSVRRESGRLAVSRALPPGLGTTIGKYIGGRVRGRGRSRSRRSRTQRRTRKARRL
jgi:hypothetical protein